jgi:dinuclear metal center YbgI/SA1388 family protein
VVESLERFVPPALAAEWDNVGLLLGDRDSAVERVMTCLTVTPEVVSEAVTERVNLIVTHHPLMFRPVQRITTATVEGRMLLELAQAGTAVYCPHTAFDNTSGGINDMLAARLSLKDVKPLRPREGTPQCKMVIFVPDSDLARVSDALFAAGAGQIGQYRECGFRVPGTGTFFGSELTNPTVGEKGRREEVSEWRLEVVCPDDRVEQAVTAMRHSHSYEEPAFDVYPLRPTTTCGGKGRIGELAQRVSVSNLANQIKAILAAGAVQVVGDTGRLVDRVAIVCGAGGEFINDAVRANADVLLTGESRFHDYLAAQSRGLALVLPGHYATERFGVEELAHRMQRDWPTLLIWASRAERDPLKTL